MRCPACAGNTVSFLRFWIRGGTGRYRCRDCGAWLRVQRNRALAALSGVLAAAAALAGFLLGSGAALAGLLLAVLIVDALLDLCFRRLVPAEPQPGEGP